jgi:acyl-CoA thioesterase-1
LGKSRFLVAAIFAVVFACAGVAPSANAQFRRQPSPQMHALFLGDSYSVGVGATPWTQGFVYKVAEHYGWQPHNYSARAVGYLKGKTPTSFPILSKCLSPQGCLHYSEQFEKAIADGIRPDIVFVSGGRNDDPGPTFEPAVKALLAEIKLVTPHAKIFVTSPINYGPESAVMAYKSAIVRDACRDENVSFIELGAPLLTHTGLLYRDQIHPSNKGSLLLADLIKRQIDAGSSGQLNF